MTFQELFKKYQKALDELPAILAAEIAKYEDDNFKAQGFLDDAFQPWAPRKGKGKNKRDRSRAIGVKTGRMRRGNRLVYNRYFVGTRNRVPWAAAFNEGVHGTVSVRAHSRQGRKRKERFQDEATGNRRSRTVRGAGGQVQAHSRQMDTPARPFAKPSNVLMRRLGYVTARKLEGR